MHKVLIIADDLTGANDSAVQFAERGFRAATVLCSDDGRVRFPLPDAEVLAVSTESRNVEAGQAVELVRRIVPTLIERFSPEVVFKKIDSTLRGNPGAEVRYLSHLLKIPSIINPGYPQNGRTVKDGRLYVDGVALSETYAASDPLAPAVSSRVADYFDSSATEFTIADAASQADLEGLVLSRESGGSGVLWVGSAGLARALADTLGLRLEVATSTRAHSRSRDVEDQSGRILVLFGSLHPVAISQVEALIGVPGCEVVLPESEAELPAVEALLSRASEPIVAVAAHRVRFRDNVDAGAAAAVVRSFFSGLALQAAGSRQYKNMVISGGDIAYAVLRSLGASAVSISREVLPGVAFGSIIGGMAEGTGVVTKAGGFGRPEALRDIIAWLGSER